MCSLIIRKKRGGALSRDEIRWMIQGYTSGEIPDYQMSAMMMAVCFTGMSGEETKELTLAMAESGDVLDLSSIRGIKVDKHSTGGVGDKTTLVLAPLAASLGVPVAKMSGRGLGHTGGTIDKLESFSGFRTDLSPEEFVRHVNRYHIAVAGQTADLAPADKKLYALRDVTGTVDQMSLIASSIMSKKLASGADAIVLDVKTGDGAFMKRLEDARALAAEMVNIGKMAGKDVTAVISDMDQPLGCAVGNALEVKEAIDTLRGCGPEDLRELVLVLGSLMTVKAGCAGDVREARGMLEASLGDGRAFETFCRFIRAQGGDVSQAEHPEKLPAAPFQMEVPARENGYVGDIRTEEVGGVCLMLGGGRVTKESRIDLSAGIVLKRKKGDAVRKGEPLAVLHASDRAQMEAAAERLSRAFLITGEKPEREPLIKEIIG